MAGVGRARGQQHRLGARRARPWLADAPGQGVHAFPACLHPCLGHRASLLLALIVLCMHWQASISALVIPPLTAGRAAQEERIMWGA